MSPSSRKKRRHKGISKRGLAALDGVTLDRRVLAADRRQGVFKQSFEQFSGRMISRDRLTKGAKLMQQHAGELKRIEQKYGVPGAVVVAIWGLETDYGVNQGKLTVVRSVATLAYDCRRSDKFQAELIDALRIVDRGDMASADMQGDWAGEIGQTQFLPVVLCEIRGQLRRPRPRRTWCAARRTCSPPPPIISRATAGSAARAGARASRISPLIKEWNKAEVYAKTIALFADKLNGGHCDRRPRRTTEPQTVERHAKAAVTTSRARGVIAYV